MDKAFNLRIPTTSSLISQVKIATMFCSNFENTFQYLTSCALRVNRWDQVNDSFTTGSHKTYTTQSHKTHTNQCDGFNWQKTHFDFPDIWHVDINNLIQPQNPQTNHCNRIYEEHLWLHEYESWRFFFLMTTKSNWNHTNVISQIAQIIFYSQRKHCSYKSLLLFL